METREAINRQVGLRIRQLRIMRGKSQKDLAACIGVAPQQIQKYETGKDSASPWRLWLIALALEVQTAVLLEGLPQPWPVKGLQHEVAMMQAFGQLPPDLQRRLLALARMMVAR